MNPCPSIVSYREWSSPLLLNHRVLKELKVFSIRSTFQSHLANVSSKLISTPRKAAYVLTIAYLSKNNLFPPLGNCLYYLYWSRNKRNSRKRSSTFASRKQWWIGWSRGILVRKNRFPVRQCSCGSLWEKCCLPSSALCAQCAGYPSGMSIHIVIVLSSKSEIERVWKSCSQRLDFAFRQGRIDQVPCYWLWLLPKRCHRFGQKVRFIIKTISR